MAYEVVPTVSAWSAAYTRYAKASPKGVEDVDACATTIGCVEVGKLEAWRYLGASPCCIRSWALDLSSCLLPRVGQLYACHLAPLSIIESINFASRCCHGVNCGRKGMKSRSCRWVVVLSEGSKRDQSNAAA